MKQKTQLAAEIKTVLDSWVRFEAQEREAEQRLLTETVIEKVAQTIRDDKTQKQILDSAVAEIERMYILFCRICSEASPRALTDLYYRARQEQEDLIWSADARS